MTDIETQPAHSPLGASTYKRWKNCPGSVALCKTMPASPPSSYAAEGTKAHEIAALYLENLFRTGRDCLNAITEMEEHCLEYARTIFNDGHGLGPRGYWIEHRFDLSHIHPGMFGTADAVVYYPAFGRLMVYDFKYGAGVPVEIVDENGNGNEQLLYYALGALETLNLKVQEVEIVIVQPRCPHPKGSIRRLRLDVSTFIDFAADLKDAAERTESSETVYVPGDHCRWCPAAGVCPSLHSKAVTVAKHEFSREVPYNPQDLAKVLDWLPVLESWIDQVRNFAYGESLHGRPPPGWKVVAKRASRKWRDEEEAISTLYKICDAEDMNKDVIFDFKLKSPAQIEKLLPKHLKEKWGEQTVAISTGSTLVRASDKRESLRLDAKSEFTAIEE